MAASPKTAWLIAVVAFAISLDSSVLAAEPDPATQHQLKALEAARAAGILTDQEYAQKKAALAGPYRPPAKAPQTPVAAPAAPKGYKTYRHSLGFAFAYPSDWRVQETSIGVQLVPPNVKSGPYGPAEAYVVMANAAPGITKPDDPRVIQYFDAALRQFMPFLQRSGAPTPLKAGPNAATELAWAGTNPAGMQVRAQVFATLIQSYGVALVALGEVQQLAARRPALLHVFSTFGLGQAQVDSRLVGRWRNERGKFQPRPRPGLSYTATRIMVLQADGSLAITGNFVANPEGGGLGTGYSKPKQGRWGAANGKLTLLWPDGASAQYQYYVQGVPGRREMLLTPASGKKELWVESR